MDITKMPPLLCAGITTYAPIKRYQKVGGSCAIIGIGGLGHLAVQYANKLGNFFILSKACKSQLSQQKPRILMS
jgi:D-arabinose 1-dehydrogenase-like Zn-dependent alcohol dehydrogenase